MSKEYKELNMDRTKIITVLKKQCEIIAQEFQINDDFVEKDGTRRRLNVVIDQKEFYIDFHFRQNGTTTIEDFGGKNVELKKELCKAIKEECEIGNGAKNRWFIAKEIQKSDFDAILDLIQKSNFYKEVKEQTKDDVKEFYKINGEYGETLTITYFNTKKVMLQGIPLMLFSEAVEMLCSLIDHEEVPKLFNDYYNVDIRENDVLEQYKIYMPNFSKSSFSVKLEKCLLQAVYNMNLEGEMFDYTFLIFPAFRGLEGHLRYVLKENNITLDGTNLYICDNFQLKQHYCEQIKQKDSIHYGQKIKHIERVFRLLQDKRNAYFHWNAPSERVTLDSTRMVTSLPIAKGLITDTISLIDEYYGL